MILFNGSILFLLPFTVYQATRVTSYCIVSLLEGGKSFRSQQDEDLFNVEAESQVGTNEITGQDGL